MIEHQQRFRTALKGHPPLAALGAVKVRQFTFRGGSARMECVVAIVLDEQHA